MREFPVFQDLSDAESSAFLEQAESVAFESGEQFIRQGEVDGSIYLLLSGSVRVFLLVDHGEQELAQLDAPCVLGEMEFLSQTKRSANVAAASATNGYRISAQRLRSSLQAGEPATWKVFFSIAKVLALRLDAMNRRMTEVIHSAAPDRSEDLKDFQRKLLTEWSF